MKKTFRITVLLTLVLALTTAGLLPAAAATRSDFKKRFDAAASAATAAIVYDLTDETTLYAKNIDRPLGLASITKVLTACTAAQFLSADDKITVGNEVYLTADIGSRAPVYYGDRYTFEQILHAMLLPSGCDAAMVIAAAAGKKAAGDNSLSGRQAVNVFLGEMNKFIKKLGGTNSHFVNPDGQDASGQHTTCRDYIKVLRYAVMHPLISSVIRKDEYACYDLNGNYHYFSTTNSLLARGSYYYYPGVIGIKTGTTYQAGACLAGAVQRNGKTILTLVAHAPSMSERYTISTKLLDIAFAFRMTGDVDYDNRISAEDARLALRLSVGLESADDYPPQYADMDGDGIVSPGDARTILRVSVGLE